MMKETLFNDSSGTPVHRSWNKLPTHALTIPPYKYMDNFVGALCGKIGRTRVQRIFENLCGLDLCCRSVHATETKSRLECAPPTNISRDFLTRRQCTLHAVRKASR